MICSPVASIFNASVNQGTVPTLSKCADVVPIAKISKPLSVDSNFRTISLHSTLSKVLEDFVFGWLHPIIMPRLELEELKTHQLPMR